MTALRDTSGDRAILGRPSRRHRDRAAGLHLFRGAGCRRERPWRGFADLMRTWTAAAARMKRGELIFDLYLELRVDTLRCQKEN